MTEFAMKAMLLLRVMILYFSPYTLLDSFFLERDGINDEGDTLGT